MALSCDGKTGFIASVREGGLGDYDIYKFAFDKPIVNVPMCWLKGKGITSIGTAAKGALVFVTEATTGASVAEIEANEMTGRFDVALAPGDYKILLKHPKAGRVESSIKVEVGQTRLDLDLVFP